MEEDYLKVGDLVKVTNFDGATGHLIKLRYGTASTFEVVEIEFYRDARHIGKNLASIKPPESSDEPIDAHWERLEKISGGRTLPEPDMDLDEIHRAQELMR